MKKIIALLLIFPSLVFADVVHFEWDYPIDQDIDSFSIYSGPMRQSETGSWVPEFGADPLLSGIDPAARSATATNPGLPAIDHNFCYVIRAVRRGFESNNSNQVCARINNTPLMAPIELQGEYDDEQESVSLSWAQTDISRAAFWNVYYRFVDDPGAGFIELGRVDNIGQTEPTITRAMENVPDDQITSVAFAVVAYKDYEIYSPNSAEITIYIDRRSKQVPPVNNFRFRINIPVE